MEKHIKKSEKWRPKYKWIESISIDLKTGKEKFKYFIPKTLEEKEKLKAEFDKRMDRIFDILLNEVKKDSSVKLKDCS